MLELLWRTVATCSITELDVERGVLELRRGRPPQLKQQARLERELPP